VFDTFLYRSTASLFLPSSQRGFRGIAYNELRLSEPSCRVTTDNVGALVNAYDMVQGVHKDGNRLAADGRTHMVFVKQGTQWKIVSCQFSHMRNTA